MSELSEFQAFTKCKCPRCRKGHVFTGRAYAFKMQKMNVKCESCNLRYEREPGFFYVAMFVSYAMNVAEIITLSVASYVLGLELVYENLWYFLAIMFSGALIMAPFNFRYSRMIQLYWLTPGLRYEPALAEKLK